MTSTTFWSRVWRISAHPSPQYPQVLSARFIIQGRNSYIESRLVIAPTGQICTQPPQNSQSNWCPAKCTISVIVLLPALPNALTSMTSSQYRTQRRSEEHTSELQSQSNLVCRLLLEKKKNESQALQNTMGKGRRITGP